MIKKQFKLITLSILALAGCAQSAPTNDPGRDKWDMKPLGPKVPALEWKPAEKKRPLQSNLKVLSAEGEPLVLARDTYPLAKIVIPSDNDHNTRQAAIVLQQMWQKISGAKLPIVLESTLAKEEKNQTLISLGATELAKQANITASDLQPEGYRLQTQGNILFIVGNDQAKASRVHGTRNGVYALLERRFDCRWLWPGELGEAYPSKNVLTLEPIHEQDEPALKIRNLRNYYPGNFYNLSHRRPHHQHIGSLGKIDRSLESFVGKTQDSGTWFEAMRLGQSFDLRYTHAYGNLWEKYGKSHPEFFALQPDGTRDQSTGPRQGRLDVSNDELIKVIAQDAIERFKADPNLDTISISPNDGGPPGFCMCEVCRRLDPPNAPKQKMNLGKNRKGREYVSLSDRYVTFYAKIAEIVQKELPDRQLGAYAYSAYKTPPLYAKLPSNVIVGFVGLGYLGEAGRKADLQDWDLWSRATEHLMLRPNAFYGGLGFPVVYPHRLGEDIKHTYQTGMMGVDFDSVQHNWAGQGLNYYIISRLVWDPTQDVSEIVQDYIEKGFGTAAPTIQKYFAALEEITDQLAENEVDWSDAEVQIANRAVFRQLRVLTDHFTDSKLDELQALLDKAKTEAQGDKTTLARIDFLSQSLRYARAQSKPSRLFLEMIVDKNVGDNPANRKALMEALEERQAVFQDIYDHHFYAQSMINPMHRESTMWEEFGWKK